MSGTSNSISSALAQFMRLETNALEVLSKLTEATSSNAETVTINQLNPDGTTSTVNVPSFGFLKGEITRLDNNIQQLAGLGDSSAVIRMPDGTVKKIFDSAILRDPAVISSLIAPSSFKIKNNWFFESYLNPLLYVGIDVSGQVPDDMERAVVKRIILNIDSDVKKDYFDLEYKGRSDVSYRDLLVDLDANSISYFVDEDIVDMPVSVMRYKGAFDVTRIFDEDVTITSNGTTIVATKRKYRMNKLSYTDVTTGLMDTKSLQNGDYMVTSDGSRYLVESMDSAEKTAVLKRVSGNQRVAVGVGVLGIYSPPYKVKEIQVGIGFDERQVVFVKQIDAKFSVAASEFSPGIAFWSSELTISTAEGLTTLDSYYKSQVTDFGLQFLNAAKERQVPSVYGETPNVPALTSSNFKVIQINTHKQDTKEIDDIKQKLSTKVSLENEINQINLAIDGKKNDLNNNSASKSESERQKIKADLESLARDKVSKVNLYSSVVNDIATKAKQNPTSTDSPKFRARGFWPMPDPMVSDKTAPQNVIQFKIAYRYLKKDGNAPGTEQLDFVDTDGTVKRGFFSNWTEYKSDLRQKTYSTETGFYEWATEDVSDADKVNINQLDISISNGEQVEIKVKSISEAGWPLNPTESDWSDSILIDFPADLQISSDTNSLLDGAAAEDTRVKFQEELNARGLDLHLLSAFSSSDKYYAHTSDDIASGFFTAEGKVIDLFAKLKQIDNTLQQLSDLVSRAKGALSVFLLDDAGNVTKVTPNSTIKLFAGYYKELISTGSGNSITYNHGRIVTRLYTLRVENSAASPLELASYVPGGLNEILPLSSPASGISTDYDNNRKYGEVAVSLSGITTPLSGDAGQQAPFQSAQVKSEWVYSRRKSVGLDEDMYLAPDGTTGLLSSGLPSAFYDYQGTTSTALGTGVRVPANGFQLLPFDPISSTIGTTTNASVWNGQATVAGIPDGGGYLTEFCIHKDHPDLATLPAAYLFDYLVPTLFITPALAAATAVNTFYMQYPKFTHSLYFNDDVTSAYGRKQLHYIGIAANGGYVERAESTVAGGLNDLAITPNQTIYPPKLGFYKNDEYLIGKYTCGAYFYMSPVNYNVDINVDGSTELAKKLLEFGEDKGVNIPIVFQMRASDKLAKVGGYRATGDITNITYTKKIGIDLQVRAEAPFSFDIEVTGKYDKDSLVNVTYIPNVSLERLTSIRQANVVTRAITPFLQ